MRYKIERIAWSESTYNGYEDNPYWQITLTDGRELGLTDDGELWSIDNRVIDGVVVNEVNTVIDECKLKITLNLSQTAI
jgi:hypothetical protein